MFLLQAFHGIYIILAIPLALSGSATAEALLMCAILLWRLQKRVVLDQGMVRLVRRRKYEERQKSVQDGMLVKNEM